MFERRFGVLRDRGVDIDEETVSKQKPRPVVGKRTLVEEWVQRLAEATSLQPTEQPETVRAAAARGIAGGGHALPHRETIQRLFGRHDIGSIVAHTDAEARAGSQAMGARAYATGHHVAFASSPDLHTAAHEAAHVVQQRAGVHLKDGGVGQVGDEYERHADAVADRIVAGHSAEDLLDRFAASSGSGGAAAIQRAPGDPPPTPSPAQTPVAPVATTTASPDAYHASSSAHDPAAPASRNATWAQIHAAATDPKAREALDITWIDSLPDPIKTSIDESFADSVRDTKLQKQKTNDAELKKIDQEAAQQLKELETEAAQRLAAADPTFAKKHGKERGAALATDPEYVAQRDHIESDRLTRKMHRENEMKEALDGPMPAGSRADSVVSPPTPMITRLEGKALARTNFMSWAIDVLGSAQAAKRHFQSIRQVARQPRFYLISAAADRFEAAREAFEHAHPGYTFPSTDVATAMRGLHQTRQGIGMLGHALGVAFDLLANDNPNQKLGNTAHYGYLLDKFGGRGGKDGRSVMKLGDGADDAISTMGKNTIANTPSANDDAMVEKVRNQFNEMAATSDQLRASMSTHLEVLSNARDVYFNSKETEQALAQATRDEKNGDALAAQQLKAEKFTGDATERAARIIDIKAELSHKKEQLAADLEASKKSVSASLRGAFADWITTIKADIAAAEARKAGSDAELAAQAATRDVLSAIDPIAADAVAQLDAFADQQKLKKPQQKLRPTGYKALLQNELRAKQQPRAATDKMSPRIFERSSRS